MVIPKSVRINFKNEEVEKFVSTNRPNSKTLESGLEGHKMLTITEISEKNCHEFDTFSRYSEKVKNYG